MFDIVLNYNIIKRGDTMTLQQLRYIIEVANKGKISEAAKSLFISQPSLTNAIKELEKEMGITIFQRTNKGIILTNEGNEFLGYARAIIEQTSLLEERYISQSKQAPHFSVSCQHYSFTVNAFVDVIKAYDASSYEFTLRETQTNEIIDDVSHLISEIGVLYLSPHNETVIKKFIKQNDLIFHELITVKPHVFISSSHPLANYDIISMKDLEDYPYLTFEQGQYNSFYFSEEIVSTMDIKKNIKVRDRATLFNLVLGLNGYTVSSGIIDHNLNGEFIISKPLNYDSYMTIGYITKKNVPLSRYGHTFIEYLKIHLGGQNE